MSINRTNINKIAFRIIGGLISAFLLLGGYGMYDSEQKLKSWIGLIAGILILIMITTSKQPKWWLWVLILVILFIALFLIGYINHHSNWLS